MGDKVQRRDRGDKGQGQGREKGTEEWVTGDKREKSQKMHVVHH
jgi:hypothetical protein